MSGQHQRDRFGQADSPAGFFLGAVRACPEASLSEHAGEEALWAAIARVLREADEGDRATRPELRVVRREGGMR